LLSAKCFIINMLPAATAAIPTTHHRTFIKFFSTNIDSMLKEN